MVEGLQKGDEVIAVGIIGRITKVGDGYIGLEVGEGKVMHVQKQAVTTLLPKGTFNDVTK
jgi:preprotein translocase subunit YajC